MISRSLRQRLRRPSRTGLQACFLDSFVVFLLTCVLIFPLFRLKYLDNWASIESTFISDARFLREHLLHPGWQPLWYCGTRFDYIYPPALRYGTALTSLAFHMTTARAYHLYTAVLYALGMAGVYWLVYAGSRSRLQASTAAISCALLSPSLVLMRDFGLDSPDWVPQRLHVLMTYGEGPHISALSLLGFALAASFVALRKGSALALVGAGILSAAVVSNNFYGATALALFFPILVWAVWLEAPSSRVWLQAAAIPTIAYGLCAFWLTPSYIRITQSNLRWVAVPGKPWCIVTMAGCAAAFCVVTFFIARGRENVAWPVFIAGSALFTSVYVLGWYYFAFRVTGDAARLAPELDLALILLLTYCMSLGLPGRIAVGLLLCVACYPAYHYARHAWSIFPRATAIESRVEFRITKWMNDHLPGVRALPSGSVRFWYDAWYNNAEVHGGSDQGMLNQLIPQANWWVLQGERADVAASWLQALGADAVIVPGKTSQEVYHDFAHPEKFQGVLTAIYDDHQGNVVYQVPRRFPAIARVVDRDLVLASLPSRSAADLARYVAAIEHGPDSPVILKWSGTDALDLTATTTPGQALLLQETFDPAWHAYAGKQPLRITPDPISFMLLNTPSGPHTIHMQFETPLENRIGWLITALTSVSILVLLSWRVLRKSAISTC